MLKVKEYSSFEAFEQDEHRQDVDLVAIVNKPNGMVCADLYQLSGCQHHTITPVSARAAKQFLERFGSRA